MRSNAELYLIRRMSVLKKASPSEILSIILPKLRAGKMPMHLEEMEAEPLIEKIVENMRLDRLNKEEALWG